jgi:putative Mn2+ efflux pump MntP
VPLELLALVLPLSLDTFAVSAALGVAGMTARERLRLSLLLGAFEALMPLVGVLAGGLLGHALRAWADLAAIGVLAAVGVLMLRDGDELPRSDLASRSRGLAAVGLAVSVSLDELAIGLGIGLLSLPLAPVLGLIALQAVVASQLGSRLGGRIAVGLRERAEQIAGGVLLCLAAALLVLRLLGRAP